MSKRRVSRRWMLATTAASAAAAASATSIVAAATSSSRARALSRANWDLIVVGGGTAGLPAALFAARRGAKVLLLEKASQIGGTLWFSGGQMSAAGTRLQAAKGIEDSPAQHLADIMRISRGTANADVVRLAVENAAGTVDWLESKGYQIASAFPVDATGHEPYSRRRVVGAEDRGLAILHVLEKELASAPATLQLQTDTNVVEPILDRKGAVVGVVATDAAGVRRDHRAPHVVLASGGYMANPGLFQRLNGIPQYRAAGWPHNSGAGIEIGLAAGGWTRGRENYLCDIGSIPATIDGPSGELARSIHHPERRPPWEIAVNARGERFLAEDTPSVDTRERALLGQPDHRYWLVFDEEILRRAPALVHSAPPGKTADWSRDDLIEAFGGLPAFSAAPTLAELAARTGIDAAGLEQTVARYNAAQAAGNDALGRRHMPLPIVRPPFYAIRHQGGTLIGVAGLAVDPSLRVMRQDGSPVKGLYAAGELLGNGTLSGQAFCAGMMVTPALSLGRWLGTTLPVGNVRAGRPT